MEEPARCVPANAKRVSFGTERDINQSPKNIPDRPTSPTTVSTNQQGYSVGGNERASSPTSIVGSTDMRSTGDPSTAWPQNGNSGFSDNHDIAKGTYSPWLPQTPPQTTSGNVQQPFQVVCVYMHR